MGRRIAVTLAIILVAIVAVAELAGAAWLRSERGRAFLAREMSAFIASKINGRLTVGHISGPLWSWAVLEDAHLYDAQGAEVGHAAKIAVDFDPWTAPSHRLHIRRLYVVDPDLKAQPIADGRLHLQELFDFLRQHQRSLRIDGLVLENTTVRMRPIRGPLDLVDRARVVLRLFFVDRSQWGRVDLLDVAGRMQLEHGPPRPLALDATLHWDPDTLMAADAAHLRAGDSQVDGSVAFRRGRFDLELTRVHVTPGDLHQLAPIEMPPADIDGRVTIHGPLEQLAIDLLLHPGEGTVHLRGQTDWPQKLLAATVDQHKLRGAFFPKRPPLVIDDARLQLRVKVGAHGVVGPVTLTNGRGSIKNVPFEAGSAAAVLFPDGVDLARAALEIPGGAVSGQGHVGYKGRIRLGMRLQVTEAHKLVEALKGKWELPGARHGRPAVTVDLEVIKRPKQKAHLDVKHIGLERRVARTRGGRPL